jgi:hypothetical protein
VPADAEAPCAPGPLLLAGTSVVAFWTGASHGDQRLIVEQGWSPEQGWSVPEQATSAPDQARSTPDEVPGNLSVAGLRQVHGSDVVIVDSGACRTPGRESGPCEGDAALASDETTCPAVLVADCLPIAIGSAEGVRVAVHAGWRGLVAGVVASAASAARRAGASDLVAGLGPCIGPCCYEFSPADLEKVMQVLGSRAGATTTDGRPSLDIRAAAHEALEAAGVRVDVDVVSCTSCSGGWYSARARGDIARQALYVWRAQ